MLVIRPVCMSDLPAMERMAQESGVGVTSLPAQREKLFEKIQWAVRSFEQDAGQVDGTEYYTFVAELDGKLVATASILSSAGLDEPFYTYRSDTIVHASRSLKVNNRMHILNVSHDLTGRVQLCGFYCSLHDDDLAAEVISRVRLMFMAMQKERFGTHVIAEMQGLHNEVGQSPFWDAIGRKFFAMDFPQVEQVFATHNKTFIAELMPSYPVYVSLLPDEAQSAIGQVHNNFERPCNILMNEGFECDSYIDIFDGGAVLTANVEHVKTIQNTQQQQVQISASLSDDAFDAIIATQNNGFVAVVGKVTVEDSITYIHPDCAEALNLSNGDTVSVIALNTQGVSL